MSIKYSICIVTHNRKAELQFTIKHLLERIDAYTEIIVGLDGCTDGTNELRSDFPDVIWIEFPTQIGASAARRTIYEKAKGDIIFGFDDDSHAVTIDFLSKTEQVFRNDPQIG
ncbi:MAG: glycosyltransferase family 2 protein, partial [Bacteroidota bacterium]